jgi:hypothetical protein
MDELSHLDEFLSAQIRVARLYIFKPKIPIWLNIGEP